jgi:hypothetical protein
MKDHRRCFGWVLGILLLWVAIIPTMAEQALPTTPLPLFGGGLLDPQSLKGQVVVIRFLASW